MTDTYNINAMSDLQTIKDTVDHIRTVQKYLAKAINELADRAVLHDRSKLDSPELELFVKWTPLLKGSTYGTDEYYEMLKELKPALDHHYAMNSHHPEHYPEGIDGMDLFDIIEMLVDWKAASERHADGDIYRSLEISRKRFNINDQLYNILKNTVDRYYALQT